MVELTPEILETFKEYIEPLYEQTLIKKDLFIQYVLANLEYYLDLDIGELVTITEIIDHEFIDYTENLYEHDNIDLNYFNDKLDDLFPTLDFIDKQAVETDIIRIFEGKYNVKDETEITEDEICETKEEPIDITIGIEYISSLNEDFTKHIESIFEVLFPENGELMTLLWSSAVSTVRGEANIVIIEGNSGEGKSVLMEYVLDFIPEKYIIRLNKATLPALLTRTYEEGSNYLDKKIIYLGDLGSRKTWEESDELRTVLRILLTDKHWAREITDYKETEGKVSEKVVLNEELIGSPAMWFTTVISERDDQDNDRSIIGTVDLSKSDKVIDRIQHLRNKQSQTSRDINELLREKIPIVHSVFESLIRAREEVIIPYRVADFKYRFRDSKKIVDLTTLLALVNKDRRQRYGEFILPSKSDMIQVLGLLEKGSGNMKDLTNKRLSQIFKEYEYNQFTRNDAMAVKGFNDVYSRSDVMYNDLIRPAIKEGIIEQCIEVGERGAKLYKFIDAPHSQLKTYNMPEIDYGMLEYEYGKYDITEPNISDKAEA